MTGRDWLRALEFGVPEIDADHRVMIDLLRSARRAARAGDRKRCGLLLKRILDFVPDHFRREEAFLHRHGYPDVGAHCDRHGDFLDKARALRPQGYETLAAEPDRACDNMWSFVIDEIARGDLRLKTFLRQARLALSA